MELGKTQTLSIRRLSSPGAILEGNILLPRKYVPQAAKVGDAVEVFLLRDSEDRPVAVRRKPYVEVGGFAFLKVKEVGRVGAFLDWGLEKDLFLPFAEQQHHVKPDERILIYCYVDSSDRICATMRLRDHFQKPKHLKENDWVQAEVYAVNPEIGAFVLVEGRYNGLLPKEEQKGALAIGEKLSLRVERVKPDGKIDLSLHSRAYEELDASTAAVEKKLQQHRGYLPFNDHTDPAVIRRELGMSKAQFKRSVGRLLRMGRVAFEGKGIRLHGGSERRGKK